MYQWAFAVRSFGAIVAAIATCIIASGCVPLGLTVAMATGVAHTLGGIVYKTVAAQQSKGQHATVAALLAASGSVTDEMEFALFGVGVRGCCRSDIEPQLLKRVVLI